MTRQRFFDWQMLISCWHIMISSSRSARSIKNFYSSLSQSIKCLRACYLMNKMPVDEKRIRITISTLHHMGIPDFLKNCFRILAHNNCSFVLHSLKHKSPCQLNVTGRFELCWHEGEKFYFMFKCIELKIFLFAYNC